MKADIENISSPSAVRRWQMDDVTFTYIVDGAMWMSPKGFLPAITGSYWLDHPGRISESGLVGMSTGGLLVERAANADAKH